MQTIASFPSNQDDISIEHANSEDSEPSSLSMLGTVKARCSELNEHEIPFS